MNLYSRVQMFLFKAQKHADKELESSLEDCGLTLEQVKDPLYFPKQRKIVACKAARMVYDVHEHMTTSTWERGMTGARGLALATKDAAKAGVEAMPSIRAGAKVVARELGEEALSQLSRRVPLDRLPVVGARIAARVQQAQA